MLIPRPFSNVALYFWVGLGLGSGSFEKACYASTPLKLRTCENCQNCAILLFVCSLVVEVSTSDFAFRLRILLVFRQNMVHYVKMEDGKVMPIQEMLKSIER